jgi:hypothetical protein
MAEYVAGSKYGLGYESTNGTGVAPSVGIPQEGLITLGLGDEYENTPKFQGKPYAVTNEYVHIGKMPSASGFSHNLSPYILNRLLASMHGTPGDETTNVFVIGTNAAGDAYPSQGVAYTHGGTTYPYTLTAVHTTGAAGAVDHRIEGCVCSNLTLTFPAAGGPVKMAYDLVGSESEVLDATGTFTLETTGQDAIASDFTFEYGPFGSDDPFYPTGDVVITLTPEIEVLKRGESRPYSIIVHKWGGSFSFNLPWDAAGDVNDLHEAYTDGEFFNLKVWNDSTPDAVGEYYFNMRGRLLSPPTLGGDGLIHEAAEFTICGDVSNIPYTITYFDDVIS